MMNPVNRPARKLLALCMLSAIPLSALAQSTTTRSPNALGLMVPAYASPNDSRAMWNQLVQLGNSNSTKLAVIVKPQSNPTGQTADSAYVNSAGNGPLVDLTNSSAQVYGHIATDNGTRSLSAVQADIARFYQNSYWNGSSMRLDGIYLDGVSSNLGQVGYYQTLRNTLRSFDANATMIGNMGSNTVSNPSGQSQYKVDDFVDNFDTMVTFDGTSSVFASSYQSPAWTGAESSAKVANFIHSSATEADMREQVLNARRSGAGWVFVTDDTSQNSTDNPYDRLPAYWEAEISLARATTNDPGRLVSGNLSGAWFDPSRGGEGFLLDIATVGDRNVFYATWFTYLNGQPWWLTGNQDLPDGATTVPTMTMSSTSGTGFGNAFNSSQIRYTPVGTASFQFISCNQLQVTYTINGETGSRVLRRLVGNLTGVSCS